MTKENPDLRAFISKFQSTFPGLDSLRRTSALISLSEAIFEHYQPSTPTIVKLCIHFVIEKTDLTDDTCNGLDSTVSVLSIVMTSSRTTIKCLTTCSGHLKIMRFAVRNTNQGPL